MCSYYVTLKDPINICQYVMSFILRNMCLLVISLILCNMCL